MKRKFSIKRIELSRLDSAALAFAVLLSFASLARGAVYDSVIAVLILTLIPVLWVSLKAGRAVHEGLQKTFMGTMLAFALVLFLQWVTPAQGDSAALWRSLHEVTGIDAGNSMIQDKSAWVSGIARILFFIISFVIALQIGASESSTRWFLNGLLVSGSLCVALTFFVATSRGVPVTTYHSYHHGFVNPNNASSYLGIMLLLGLAQSVRYFRAPSKPFQKIFVEIIDKLSIPALMKGVFYLFTVLLALAGLFMSASRGGIVLTMVGVLIFLFSVLYKVNLKSRTRKLMIVVTILAVSFVLVWSFTNYGKIIASKVQVSGANSNSRIDIMNSVLPMIEDHPLLGTGLGSFPATFQQYRPTNVSSDGIIDKAHNSYLEFAAEMGVPALFALLILLGRIGWWLVEGVRGRKERYITPALGLSIWVFVGLHSTIDFPLQIPSIMALFIALMTVCVSQTDRRFSEPAHSSGANIKRVRVRKRRSSNKSLDQIKNALRPS